jgi:hypothetical protein
MRTNFSISLILVLSLIIAPITNAQAASQTIISSMIQPIITTFSPPDQGWRILIEQTLQAAKGTCSDCLSAKPDGITTELAASHPISITLTGFEPTLMIIMSGESVVWTNRTEIPKTLKSGTPFQVYLPLLLHNSTQAESKPAGSSDNSQIFLNPNQLLSEHVIQPGDNYSQTFPEVGTYDFYLGGMPTATCRVIVNPPPDFSVQDVSLEPNPVAAGEAVTLTTVVANVGLGDADPFSVNWEIPTIISGTWNVNELEHGKQIELTAQFIASTPGPFTVTVTADPANLFPDPNLANNTYQTELGVTGKINFCGNISTNTTWAYATYALSCDVDILAGSTLTVRSGAVVKPRGTSLHVHGTLKGRGIEATPLAITSYSDDSYGGDSNGDGSATSPSPGDWASVYVYPGGDLHLTHTLLRYGGTPIYNQGGATTMDLTTVEQSSSSGVRSTSNGVIQIGNSLIRNNNGYGLYYSASGLAAPVITSTSFLTNTNYAVYFEPSGKISLDGTHIYSNTASNNGTNGLRLDGTYTGTTTLSGNPGFAYVMYQITVDSGSHFTIQPGAVLKMLENDTWHAPSGIQVYGYLEANGTLEKPVVFTSLTDDSYAGDTNHDGSSTTPTAGYWARIAVQDGGSASFSHAKVRYAGSSTYGYSYPGSLVNAGGALILTHATVEYGSSVGVRSISNGTIRIGDSLIQNNNSYGLYYSASGLAAPVITSTSLLTNTNYAIYFQPSDKISLDGTHIYSNTASNNGTNGLRLNGTYTGTTTLSGNPGFAYVLEWMPTVDAGSHFIIQPGAVLKAVQSDTFAAPTGMQVYGYLEVNSTIEKPVVFTSLTDDTVAGDTNHDGSASTPTAGYWSRILVQLGGSASFTNAKIRYAGCGNSGQPQGSLVNAGGALTLTHTTVEYSNSAGVRSINSGVIRIGDSLIQNTNGYGLYYSASGLAAPVITSTSFLTNTNYAVYFEPSDKITLDGTHIYSNTASNNGTNGLRMLGTYTGTTTLSGNPGFAYVFDTLYVDSGSHFTIQPGAVLKVLENDTWHTPTGLQVYGYLEANGTPEKPVVFTSLTDDSYAGDTNHDGSATTPAAGYWSRITVQPGGSASFSHAKVRYAGSANFGWPSQTSLVNAGGVLTLTHTTVEYSSSAGVNVTGGTLLIQNSQVNNNINGLNLGSTTSAATISNTAFLTNTIGINFTGTISPTISSCIFEGNSSYGVFNVVAFTIDATYNWWGDASGPYHPSSNPGGAGDQVGDGIIYSPWLGTRP